MKEKLIVFDDDGNEVELPSKLVVCDRCEGSGVHDHPAFDNGLTSEDFEDEDFKESYFNGHYDVACSACGGLRVVPSADIERLSDDQKRWLENHYQTRYEASAERRQRMAGIEF